MKRFYCCNLFGCGGMNRTYDLKVMSLASYHCSTPRKIWCQWAGSNRRPQGYESCALTSWATLASENHPSALKDESIIWRYSQSQIFILSVGSLVLRQYSQDVQRGDLWGNSHQYRMIVSYWRYNIALIVVARMTQWWVREILRVQEF